MPIYITERNLPGTTTEQIEAIQKADKEMSKRFSAEGKRVRYLRSSWVPSEAHMHCLFEAPSAQLVRDLNEAAGLSFTRIIETIELSA